MFKKMQMLRDLLINLNPGTRKMFKIVLDTGTIFFTYYLSYLVRFEWNIPGEYFKRFAVSSPVLIIFSIGLFVLFGAYSEFWVYWSVRDLKRLIAIHTSVLFMLFLVDGITKWVQVPRSIFVIYWVFSIMLFTMSRMMARTILEIHGQGKQKRILIIGAGHSGEMLIRQVQSDPKLNYKIVALIDDDPNKLGRTVHGVRICGGRESISKIAKSERVDEIIIAVPSAKFFQMKEIIGECEKSGIRVKIVPGPKELIDGKVSINRVRDVHIEDLLGRDEASINIERVGSLIKNNRIIVTGAAGSIGSELCRQIKFFEPAKLIAIDRDESALFYLSNELSDDMTFEPIIADVSNRRKIEHIFDKYRPKVIFHAAAYKHVPFMELNPEEAILNNVGSTVILSQVAIKTGVEKFIQISTDKAVNPVSIMGASKRLCELYCQYLYSKSEKGFITVRFGNVIGSQGSVTHIFKKQIKEGKAITITHPNMERFFMSIAEASKLVLEAATIGRGGSIFILDMGRSIKVMEMAKHMISLAGLILEKDILIKIIGNRPGEKLSEELWYSYEKSSRTINPKIFVAKYNNGKYEQLDERIEEILQLARELKTKEMIQKIQELVPEYKPSPLLNKSKVENV